MKTLTISAAAALLIASLAGCAPTVPAATPTSPETSSAATPTPTAPTPMTVEEAGEYYLDIVCPGYPASDDFQAALETQDLEQVRPAAAALAKVREQVAVQLDDESVVWPDERIAADVAVIRDGMFAQVGPLRAMAKAETEDEFFAVPNPNLDEMSAATPRLRTRLGISTDQDASCAER